MMWLIAFILGLISGIIIGIGVTTKVKINPYKEYPKASRLGCLNKNNFIDDFLPQFYPPHVISENQK